MHPSLTTLCSCSTTFTGETANEEAIKAQITTKSKKAFMIQPTVACEKCGVDVVVPKKTGRKHVSRQTVTFLTACSVSCYATGIDDRKSALSSEQSNPF